MHICSRKLQGKQSGAWATSTRRILIANTAWAFAMFAQADVQLFTALGQADAQLFVALAREAERRLGDFSP